MGDVMRRPPTMNSARTPITRHDPSVPVDRRYQWCRCGTCGVVSMCRPDFDFYDAGCRGPLKCHDCLVSRLQREGYSGFIDETTPQPN